MGDFHSFEVLIFLYQSCEWTQFNSKTSKLEVMGWGEKMKFRIWVPWKRLKKAGFNEKLAQFSRKMVSTLQNWTKEGNNMKRNFEVWKLKLLGIISRGKRFQLLEQKWTLEWRKKCLSVWQLRLYGRKKIWGALAESSRTDLSHVRFYLILTVVYKLLCESTNLPFKDFSFLVWNFCVNCHNGI